MESKLAELVNRLQEAAGENLQSVVLFGSAVVGEFYAEHSDLNILCLVDRTSSVDLGQLHPAIAWWLGEGNPAPLVFTYAELTRSAHLSAIEMFDIKTYHRILFGPDWLEKFQPPLQLHRLQVERQLHRERLNLRQAILAAPQKPKVYFEIMLSSVSRFCTLFRHAVMAAGEPPPQTKRESIAAMAAWTGADPSGFEAILDYREGKRKPRQIDLEAALHSYVDFVTLAANDATRHFAQLH
ncbi:MAG: nucleotidyltransferase domain-containing protein [Candidatus Acidiferrales bacterium]